MNPGGVEYGITSIGPSDCSFIFRKMLNNHTAQTDVNIPSMETLLFFQDAIVINKNYPRSVLNIFMFSLSVILMVFVNILVLLRVKMKKKVLIDRMVAMDCLANIMMVGVLVLAFPSRIWNNRYLCTAITFYRVFTVTINRYAGMLLGCRVAGIIPGFASLKHPNAVHFWQN